MTDTLDIHDFNPFADECDEGHSPKILEETSEMYLDAINKLGEIRGACPKCAMHLMMSQVLKTMRCMAEAPDPAVPPAMQRQAAAEVAYFREILTSKTRPLAPHERPGDTPERMHS